MSISDFFKKLHNHSRLACLKVVEGDSPEHDYIIVRDLKVKAFFKVFVKTILETPWMMLEEVLVGNSESNLHVKVACVAGYHLRFVNMSHAKAQNLRNRGQRSYTIERNLRNRRA